MHIYKYILMDTKYFIISRIFTEYLDVTQYVYSVIQYPRDITQ